MKTALLLALAALCATPSISEACGNGVEWTVVDDVRMVQRAERQFESGNYGAARHTLKRLRPQESRLRTRIADLRAIIQVRMHAKKEDLSKSIEHIEKRDDAAGNKDVKYRAWRAEAYFAVGMRAEAKVILDDLHARDLMPDEFGYLALAKMTTGPTRLEMWKACRTRAKDKEFCELPNEVVSARKAR